jgi:hypothetical protein
MLLQNAPKGLLPSYRSLSSARSERIKEKPTNSLQPPFTAHFYDISER